MTKILLCRASYIVEFSDDFHDKDDDELMYASNLIEKDLCIEGTEFKWISSRPAVIDTTRDNAGKCDNCGIWTTDCYADNPIKELSYGTRINHKLLCDSCLPKDHPLNFRFGGSEEIDFI